MLCTGTTLADDEQNQDTEEEDYSSDDSAKFDTIIDARKIQQLLKNTAHKAGK